MWKVVYCVPKFNEDYTNVEYTEIQISEDSPYTCITTILKGDVTKELDEKKIELVKEDFYQKNYLRRAENEKFSEFEKMMKKMKKEFDEELMKMKIAFAELMEGNTEVTEETEEHTESEVNNE